MSTPGRDESRRVHQPALDGVRGLAIALVLLFHGGFSWMSGGYVGVSVFFTLSGFLITGLLLSEHGRDGRISIRRFYVRRLRRLMPASLLCLAAVSVAASLGEFGGLPNVRRDLLAALFQVANWNSLLGGTSYADLIARTAGQLGPVDHFWSLSVEEQFYWVWPVVFVAGMARVRRRGGDVRVMLVVAAVLAVAAAPVIAAIWGPDAAYWATPARLGEILVGAALASLAVDRVGTSIRWSWLGLVGLVAILAAAVLWPADGGPAYQGWLGVFALASAALIVGLQTPGPLRSAFSVAPLVHLGRISYGVYLYHWPVFAMLTPERVGFGGWRLFLVHMIVTLAVAELSFHLLEQPIRHGVAAPRRVAWSMAGAIAAVALLIVAVVPAPSPTFSASTDVPRSFVPLPTTTATTSTTTVETSVAAMPPVVPMTTAPMTTAPATTAPTPVAPISVLVMGDSTGMSLADGVSAWAAGRPDVAQVASLARVGCGVITDARMFGDDRGHFVEDCRRVWDDELPRLLGEQVPDVVLLMATLPDTLERVWTTEEGPLHPRDARYAERLRAACAKRAAMLIDAGVPRVLWVVPPRPSEAWPQTPWNPVTDADWAAFVGALDEQARRHPEVETVRLDRWMGQHEPTDDSMRPDGLHLTADAARTVADEFLAGVLLSEEGS